MSLAGAVWTGFVRPLGIAMGDADHLVAWLMLALLATIAMAFALRRVSRDKRWGVQPSWLNPPKRRQRLAPIGLGAGSLPRIVLAPRPEAKSAPLGPQAAHRNEPVGEKPVIVHVLGPLTISGARRERRGIRAAALELIACLALHRSGCSRDGLLEALWPNDDPKKTRHRLYQATRDARRLLGDDAIGNERDLYTLDRKRVAVDADELAERMVELRRARADGTLEVAQLEEALGLFKGEPLGGSDYTWAAGEVQRLQAIETELWGELAEARLARGELQEALCAGTRGIERDPLNERHWRAALEAEGSLGRRDAVERRYTELRELLDERLGLQPDAETRALYRRLLGQT